MVDALMALAGPGAQMEEESDFPQVGYYDGDGKKCFFYMRCTIYDV